MSLFYNARYMVTVLKKFRVWTLAGLIIALCLIYFFAYLNDYQAVMRKELARISPELNEVGFSTTANANSGECYLLKDYVLLPRSRCISDTVYDKTVLTTDTEDRYLVNVGQLEDTLAANGWHDVKKNILENMVKDIPTSTYDQQRAFGKKVGRTSCVIAFYPHKTTVSRPDNDLSFSFSCSQDRRLWFF